MESAAGYMPGRNLDQHMTLAYFSVHLYMQWEGLINWWICLILYVSLLQDNVTALYFASKHNHPKIIKFLLERGAQVNKVQQCNVM